MARPLADVIADDSCSIVPFATLAKTVAVGTAVARCPPHRPVLAALPHTVLTSDMPPSGGWRGSARLDIHEQRVARVAIDRIVSPVSPRWAAFGCAVPAHGTSSGRPVAGIVSVPS